MSAIRLRADGATDAGRVRSGNEDDYLVDDRMGLVAVADGMGGHRAGEVASKTAIEALRAAVASGQAIRDAIQAANRAVLEKGTGDEQLRGMGTTLTAATLASGATLLVGHVGDSRAYLARNGSLTQITTDHSLVEEMVQEGHITAEQAEVHPQRSVITRALGIDSDLDIDMYPVELKAGDRVLICSDGLTTMVRNDDIASILGRESDPKRAAQQLVDAANSAGGEDNVTALVVDVVEDDSLPEAPVRPAVSEEEPEATPTATKRGRGRAVARILLWVIPVLLVLALAFGAVGWYARRTYYVGIDRHRVTIFKGVKGGLVGWNPTVERRTSLDPNDLTEAQRSDIQDGKRFSSFSKADDYVRRLQRDVTERTTPTTTTTVPAPAPAPTPAPPAPSTP